MASKAMYHSLKPNITNMVSSRGNSLKRLTLTTSNDDNTSMASLEKGIFYEITVSRIGPYVQANIYIIQNLAFHL